MTLSASAFAMDIGAMAAQLMGNPAAKEYRQAGKTRGSGDAAP